jgi:hypothetical protein
LQEFSPGKLLTSLLLEHLHKEGYLVFDAGRGAEAYKADYGESGSPCSGTGEQCARPDLPISPPTTPRGGLTAATPPTGGLCGESRIPERPARNGGFAFLRAAPLRPATTRSPSDGTKVTTQPGARTACSAA